MARRVNNSEMPEEMDLMGFLKSTRAGTPRGYTPRIVTNLGAKVCKFDEAKRHATLFEPCSRFSLEEGAAQFKVLI